MKPGKDHIGLGVGAIITNDEGKILLLKRSDTIDNDRSTVGMWSAPGGEVEFGERVEDATIREVKEEVGVDVEIIKNIGHTDQILKNPKLHWHGVFFLCKIKSGIPKVMELDKSEKIEWFKPEEIPENTGVAHVITPLHLMGLISEEEYQKRLKNTPES